jgi:hypothetical protein
VDDSEGSAGRPARVTTRPSRRAWPCERSVRRKARCLRGKFNLPVQASKVPHHNIISAGATNAGLGGLTKNDLAKLHTPVLYVLGGADDIAQPNGMDDFQRINHLPVFVADRKNAGHFGVFIEPNGRGTEIEIDWLEMAVRWRRGRQAHLRR